MKQYVVMIGNAVNFHRIEESDTLQGIMSKAAKARSDGYCTRLVDTHETTEDNNGVVHCKELNDDGTPNEHVSAWRALDALERMRG